MKGQILGNGLLPADDPIYQEGWSVGLPVPWPEQPAAPRREPPAADPQGEVSTPQPRRARCRHRR